MSATAGECDLPSLERLLNAYWTTVQVVDLHDRQVARPFQDVHSGQWVLADAGLRLLSVGDVHYSGQSIRSKLDPIGRRVLLPLMVEAQTTGAEMHNTRRDQGFVWSAVAIPVIGTSGQVHAVLGYYAPAGEAVSPRPVLGAWEWDVPKFQTSWTPEMFEIYGVVKRDDEPMEAPEWFGMLEPGAYPHLREVMTRAQRNPGDLITHIFKIRYARSGEYRTLRLAGQGIAGEDPHTARWFRGVTVLLDQTDSVVDPRAFSDDFYDAAILLTTDMICVIDLTSSQVTISSKDWATVGIRMPPDQRLASVVHPDDLPEFSALLLAAPYTAAEIVSEGTVRLAGIDGGWIETEVRAVRLRQNADAERDSGAAMCRLGLRAHND